MRTPCKHPGCNALLRAPGYCEKHAASAPKRGEEYQRWRRRDPAQSSVDRIRSTSRWQKVRASKLSASPLCEDPLGQHPAATVAARQVHHICGLATHPELAFHADNLQSVCAACHAALEAEVRRGPQ
jgi:5-methylcytosine-specific restriction enzyme A